MHSGARPNAHMPHINREGRKRHSHLTVLVVLSLKVIRSVIWNKQKRKKEKEEKVTKRRKERQKHMNQGAVDEVNNESLQRH